MTIAETTITPIHQRLEDRDWRFATAPLTEVPGMVVTITSSEGFCGMGYARAMPPTGLPPAAMQAVIAYLLEPLEGLDEADVAGVMRAIDQRLHGFPVAKAAIECALFDLAARRQGVPLHRLFGKPRVETLPQARILALKAPADMADHAARLIEQGYRFLKVKASGEAELDLQRIRAVGRVASGRARLMVDANQSYGVEAAIRAIPRMAEAGVELVEQPTHADDPRGFERVCRASPIPVEADESAQSLAEIRHLASNRIVTQINLRILNLGGISKVKEAAAICQDAGIHCRFGASFGPRLLQAFTAHLAVTMPEPIFAHEIAEFEHILDDPFAGLEVIHGDLRVPEGPGSGIEWRAPAELTAIKPH